MVLEIEMELLYQSTGVIGIVIFYFVIAKLSARMGEGLMLPAYYRWDYIACIIAIFTIPLHAYLHKEYADIHSGQVLLDYEGLYIFLLLLSNVIVIIVSLKYWWWLKDEILGKKLKKA